MQNAFRTLTSSVNELMQQRLYQHGEQGDTNGISPTSTALSMAIVRLYYGDSDGKFQQMKIGGILCLVVDRKLHSRYFRLYDINSYVLLFQTELYINFQQYYRELNDYFHCFPIQKLVVGVEFSTVYDAAAFKNLVQTYSFQGENHQQIIREEQKKLGISSLDISKPISFDVKEHAGWDPVSQTFLLNQVPKEIKLLLKKAGFKKKDLKSKETALAIYEILVREIEFDQPISKAGHLTSNNKSSQHSISAINDKDILSKPGGHYSVRPMGKGHPGNESNDDSRLGELMSNQYKLPSQVVVQNNIASASNYGSTGQGRENIDADQKAKIPPIITSQQVQEEVKQNKSPIPPPPMNIPPPPMGFAPPPPPINKNMIVAPQQQIINPPVRQVRNSILKKPAAALSFGEQLKLQSQNLKAVQENPAQSAKVKNLSEQQQMKITMNLAVVLEQRKKALQNSDHKNNSDVDSDEDNNNDSDNDSVW